MTGWTVYGMLFLILIVFVAMWITEIPLDAGNSSNRNWLRACQVLALMVLIILSFEVVIMSITWGQSAWVNLIGLTEEVIFASAIPVGSSETTRGTSNSSGTVNPNTKDWFEQWLVGVVDGDGTFHFSKSKDGKWSLFFKVSQSTYNLRMLYHIKSKFGVGSVVVENNNDMADFRIRRVVHIIEHVLPIFDKYPLLTSKYFHYNLFKQAAMVMSSNFSTPEKDAQLTALKNTPMPDNYVSPAWAAVNNNVTSITEAISVVSKPWLVGFTEAEGSFYITQKSAGRLVHGFAITQKQSEVIVISALALMFKVSVKVKKTYIAIDTTNSVAVAYIADYFFNTMKGMKSLEYRIWARSFTKTWNKKDYEYLLRVREQMRNIRSIRLNKNLSCLITRLPVYFSPFIGLKVLNKYLLVWMKV